ncbi:hypothetical protein TNCV_4479211 [Trichonephila clavipes]|nr:hypothetical protein TNCV_4479211 [Trichonephila clavipes]
MIFQQVQQFSFDLVSQLADQGPKPLAVASRDRNGKTALHYCAESGSLPCAQLVLSADPTLLNLPDEDGFTPLHLAIIAGNKAVARVLLKHGADPDRMDKERHSTVHWAAVCGDIESLELLLNHGANPSSPDILGAYPIHYAAQMCGAHSLNGKDPETGLNILKKLVQRGASIQCRDRDGREPLLWAASTGMLSIKLSIDPGEYYTTHQEMSSDVPVDRWEGVDGLQFVGQAYPTHALLDSSPVNMLSQSIRVISSN